MGVPHFKIGDRVSFPGLLERRSGTVVVVDYWNPRLKRPKIRVLVRPDGAGYDLQFHPKELRRGER